MLRLAGAAHNQFSMKAYHNEHVTISVEYHIHLLCQTWTGVPTSESYREGGLMALQLADGHQLKRWLIDQRQLRMFKPKDLQWFIQEWLPQAASRLPDDIQIAIVLTDMNQFSKLGADLTLRAALAANPSLQSRYFTDTQAARDWLTTRKPTVSPHHAPAYS